MPHRVADVPSYELETVTTESTLIDALETMFENDYTQLGIENDGEVVGMISYRSISRFLSILRRLGAEKNLPSRTVGMAIEELQPVVSPGDDLIILFDLLSENPYVLVRESEEATPEILTTYDLLHYLRDSIEPFLLIEDIERSTRAIIQDAFPDDLDDELREFFESKDIRTPNGLTDCSFGHYTQFMRANWPRFEPYFDENGDFVGEVIFEAGKLRNQIFHFRANPYESETEAEFLQFAHEYLQHRV